MNSSSLIREKLPKLKKECEQLLEFGIKPKVKVILVGNNPASLVYTKNKKKFLEKVNATCEIMHLDNNTSKKQLSNIISNVCNNDKNHGCLVQLPLPKHLADLELDNIIPDIKDVDGFHRNNMYKLLKGNIGDNILIPCTPKGIITLLKYYNILLEGKHVVIVGRSLIVGKPTALLFNNYNSTITMCHSQTRNLKEITKKADIIIAAIGKEKFINNKHIRTDKSQIIVDVGINKSTDGKLYGDVDFENIANKVYAITPVPNGIGPMTIFSLAENLINATKWQNNG